MVLLVLLNACRSENQHQNYIDDDKLKEIIKEMHIADAIMGDKHWHDKDYEVPEKSYYYYIFKKYGITRAQFENNLSPEIRSTESLLAVYDKAIAELQQYQTDSTTTGSDTELKRNKIEIITIEDNPEDTLDEISDEELADIVEEIDDEVLSEIEFDDQVVSVEGDIWRQQQNWSLPDEGEDEVVADNFMDVSHGTYTLKANIKLYTDDQAVSPRTNIQAFYVDGTYDEKRLDLKKDGKARDIILTLKTDRNKQLKRVRVFLLNHSTTGTKHAEVKNIRFIHTNN